MSPKFALGRRLAVYNTQKREPAGSSKGGQFASDGGSEGSKKDAITKKAHAVADKMGYDSSLITVSEKTKLAENGKPYKGEARNGQVVIYSNHVDEDTAAGIVAHELQHITTSKAIKMYQWNQDENGKVRGGRRKKEGKSGLKSDHYEEWGEQKDSHPLNEYLHPEKLKEMREGGDITGYSSSFWKDAESSNFDFYKTGLAVEETLSEMAHVQEKTGKLPGNEKWQKLFQTVQKYKG